MLTLYSSLSVLYEVAVYVVNVYYDYCTSIAKASMNVYIISSPSFNG